MQKLVAHFEDPIDTSEASKLLRTLATPLPLSEVQVLFSGDDDILTEGRVFSITVPKSDARKRLTTNVFSPTREGTEEFPDYVKVYYKPYPVLAAPAAGGKRKTRRFKKKRLMSRSYCKKTSCKKMGFTQKASCRPYKNCY